MTREQINYFNTFGFFLSKQLLSREEMEVLGNAFDAAMEKACGGAPIPQPGEKRQQIIPFFDYDAAVFYPLLDDARVLDTFEQLLGEDFILTLSEGIVHTGGSGWHHDAYAPEAGLIPAHRIAEDTRWLVVALGDHPDVGDIHVSPQANRAADSGPGSRPSSASSTMRSADSSPMELPYPLKPRAKAMRDSSGIRPTAARRSGVKP